MNKVFRLLPPAVALASVSVLTAGCGKPCSDPGLYLIQPDGSDSHRVRPSGNPPIYEAIWLPGGKRIHLDTGDCPGGSLEVKADGGGGKPYRAAPPGFAAAGTRLAPIREHFSSFPGLGQFSSFAGFMIVRAGQRQRRVLFRNGLSVGGCGGNVALPQLSPDGRLVVYPDETPSATGGQIDLYVVSTTGRGHPRRLTSDTNIEQTPVWSPNSQAIAFNVYRRNQEDAYEGIYLANIRGAPPTLISRKGEEVAWSPDGRRLVLVRGDLYLANLRGNLLRRLARAPSGGIFGVSWAPAKVIAYVADAGNPRQGKCSD